MRRVLAVVFTAMIFALGCDESNSPISTSESGVKTNIFIEPRNVFAGDSLQIVVRIVNESEEDFSKTITSTCLLHYQVETSDGDDLGPHIPCGRVVWFFSLGSGDSAERQFTLHVHDPADSLSGQNRLSLSQGTYRVVGGIGRRDDEQPWAQTSFRVW